jgi:hypothetical protein
MKKIIKFFKKWDQVWVMIMATFGLCLITIAILTVINYIVKSIN